MHSCVHGCWYQSVNRCCVRVNDVANVMYSSSIYTSHLTIKESFDAHCCHMGTARKQASCARPGYAIICNFWHSGSLLLGPECYIARMSKITNDGITRSGTGCLLYSCTHMATVGVKGLSWLVTDWLIWRNYCRSEQVIIMVQVTVRCVWVWTLIVSEEALWCACCPVCDIVSCLVSTLCLSVVCHSYCTTMSCSLIVIGQPRSTVLWLLLLYSV